MPFGEGTVAQRGVTSWWTRCSALCEHVDGCRQIALGGAHCRDCAPVARSFELVQSGPVCRKIRRVEELNVDCGSVRVEDEAWVPLLGAPALLKKLTTHGSPDPASGQATQLVMVRAARRQGAVHRKTARRSARHLGSVTRLGCTHVAGRGPLVGAPWKHTERRAAPDSQTPRPSDICGLWDLGASDDSEPPSESPRVPCQALIESGVPLAITLCSWDGDISTSRPSRNVAS